ncbi:MAG: hypothetical protein KA020_16830 [Planctomycetes bacterium]|jgi:protocatechuate 3,4-dioxygenase beta subunit|nr:hypothetical protein [Planctomycetota bacterium]MCC7064622.1 hypothetical protein [Planctomycetota bacterium]
METNPLLSRRRMLFAAAAIPAVSLLQSCATNRGRAAAVARNPADPEPTVEQTEGPFYRLFSSARSDLREPGMQGTELEVMGRVLDKHGKPLANTLLDFWQCNAAGVYDLRTYRLRGHQFTDAEGRYRLTTIVPGLYQPRTRHIHVKLQPTGADVPDAPGMLNLTTQLYFPGEPDNKKDTIFDPSLVVAMDTAGEKKLARYDFVLDLG